MVTPPWCTDPLKKTKPTFSNNHGDKSNTNSSTLTTTQNDSFNRRAGRKDWLLGPFFFSKECLAELPGEDGCVVMVEVEHLMAHETACVVAKAGAKETLPTSH